MRGIAKSTHATMAEMAADGLSYVEIAELFGITRFAVGGILFRLRHGYSNRRADSDRPTKKPIDAYHAYRDLQPAKAPYAPDCSCPDFANDDDHIRAVIAEGGFKWKVRSA